MSGCIVRASWCERAVYGAQGEAFDDDEGYDDMDGDDGGGDAYY